MYFVNIGDARKYWRCTIYPLSEVGSASMKLTVEFRRVLL
jgi:hypothetical protein